LEITRRTEDRSMNSVVHFEIHAASPERAAEFYRDVFGWDIEGNIFGVMQDDKNAG
jgi:predicted enzyme related to lactoylglutathione lyase